MRAWETFAGRVAIVTGASSGIGAATAQALAAAGAHVVLAARRTDRLEQLARQLSDANGAKADVLATDMTSRDQVERLVDATLRRHRRIDILVNNAGVGLQGDVADLPERELRYLFDVNVFGPQLAMQAVIPQMRKQGEGAIANISSILAKVTLPSLGMVGSSAGYTGSKAALHAFSLAARMELASAGIRVVTVLPGVTRSEFNEQFLVGEAGALAGDRSAERPRGSLMGITPPERVAQAILRGIEYNQREVFVTWKDRLFVWGAQAAPGLFEWSMIRLRARRVAQR
ncbi:MAG: SDR family NAD(P)-dependent oxidoreductase [Caldilineaceae bacterium]